MILLQSGIDRSLLLRHEGFLDADFDVLFLAVVEKVVDY